MQALSRQRGVRPGQKTNELKDFCNARLRPPVFFLLIQAGFLLEISICNLEHNEKATC